METIGSRIKQVRKSNAFTQQQFSRAIGLSQSRLSEIEHGEGKPSKAAIELISLRFKIDKDWLLDSQN